MVPSFSLDDAGAKALIDKIASNQSWKGERQPARPRGVHQIDTVDMLAAKLELLMKKLESPHQEVNQVSESRMTCETCGETGHSGTLLALLKYPFYPLFILDNGKNSISKSLTVLTPA